MSDQDPRYQIDVILEEARRKKQERLKYTLKPVGEEKETPFPPDVRSVNVRPRFPVSSGESGTQTERSAKPPAAEASKPVFASPSLSSASAVRESAAGTTRTKEPPKPVDAFPQDAVLQKGRAVEKIFSPGSAASPGEAVLPPRADGVKVYIPKPPKPFSAGDTKVFDRAAAAPAKRPEPPEAGEENPTGLPDGGDMEAQVKTKRQKKVEDFHLDEPGGFKLSGDEEVNEPGEEPPVFDDEEIEDFGSYEETETVRSELTYRRRVGLAKLILTGLIALALSGLSVALYVLKLPALNPVLFIGLNLFLLGVAALLNHRIFGEGIGSLFRLRATADSAAGFAALVVLLQTLAQILNLGAVADGEAVILTPAAALGLFFSALGRQMRLQRISDNFLFVSYSGEKFTARIVDDERAAEEIGRAAVDIGVPMVCYAEKTKFLSHFLRNSYQTDEGDRAMRRYMPFILGISAAVALFYGYSSHDFMNALSVFASIVCLSAPFGMASSTNFPFLRTARRTLRHGAMMIGPQAVEEFGGVHALAVDALDLFPSESVLLHGIKTFSGSRIDEAILDAAAVAISAGGPLSSVFRRVIQNRVDLLKKVDTLVYEQNMGMSGWVGGRRVLVGNRKLLENHGVDVPSHDYEARYTKNGRRIVYLSTGGELSAMFVVSYTADEGIARALDVMTSAGITLDRKSVV